MARQWFVPGIDALFQGGMIDEDGTEEWFVPGVGMINEDQAAAGFVPYPNPRYALTGGMQPMAGGT